MDTNSIQTLEGKVNVTIHKNYMKDDDSSYAKVQRTKAGMNNVIAEVLKKSKVYDAATLTAVSMLFKEAALELLSQGITVNLLELVTAYPSVEGKISSLNPNISDIPGLTLGLTPSQEALEAVAKANVSMAKQEDTSPIISEIEDLSTHRKDCTITKGKPVRITGRRLKIAGEAGQTGLFLSPLGVDGRIDENESDWIKIPEENFFKNTLTFLELILPDNLESGKQYYLVIKTAAGRGKVVNKTVRKLVYTKPLSVS